VSKVRYDEIQRSAIMSSSAEWSTEPAQGNERHAGPAARL